jgi:hypothetical protein
VRLWHDIGKITLLAHKRVIPIDSDNSPIFDVWLARKDRKNGKQMTEKPF